MSGLEIKNAEQPDERRSMSGKGEVQVVKIGDIRQWRARGSPAGAGRST
jgi:hypothetical protein